MRASFGAGMRMAGSRVVGAAEGIFGQERVEAAARRIGAAAARVDALLAEHLAPGEKKLVEAAGAYGAAELTFGAAGRMAEYGASKVAKLEMAAARAELSGASASQIGEVSYSFPVTEAVEINGRRAIDMAKVYEEAVIAKYEGLQAEVNKYRTVVDGRAVTGIADKAVVIDGKKVAVEAKFVEDWGSSLRNPESINGQKPWSMLEQSKMIEQARKYSANFAETRYHTNSAALANYYNRKFSELGIKNIRFIITPTKK